MLHINSLIVKIKYVQESPQSVKDLVQVTTLWRRRSSSNAKSTRNERTGSGSPVISPLVLRANFEVRSKHHGNGRKGWYEYQFL